MPDTYAPVTLLIADKLLAHMFFFSENHPIWQYLYEFSGDQVTAFGSVYLRNV